jgi:hypothetical protein
MPAMLKARPNTVSSMNCMIEPPNQARQASGTRLRATIEACCQRDRRARSSGAQ